jgi:hypothetical protein
MDYIKSILRDRRALDRPWFDQQIVQRVLTEHVEGRRNHRLLIWSLLSIEWVQRHFVDRGAPAPAVEAPLRPRPARERREAPGRLLSP